MAHSLSFLLSSDAAAQRIERTQSGVVVHCERADGQFVELDADDLSAGHVIADVWTLRHGAVSAAVRHVRKDGSVGKVDGRIHDESDHWVDQ